MVWRLLKKLNFKKLWELCRFAFGQPRAMFYTFKATRQCVKLCDQAYGKTHNLHNRANAVRHALWNLLIAKRVAAKKQNASSAMQWAQKITDWHEEFSVNIELAKAMDLHNNKIGRNLYVTLNGQSATDMLKHLQVIALDALKINSPEEISMAEQRLVYIHE